MLAGIARVRRKELLGNFAAALKTLRRESHRLVLARGTLDESLSMKSIHHVEIEPLPSSPAIEAESGEQCEYSVLDF